MTSAEYAKQNSQYMELVTSQVLKETRKIVSILSNKLPKDFRLRHHRAAGLPVGQKRILLVLSCGETHMMLNRCTVAALFDKPANELHKIFTRLREVFHSVGGLLPGQFSLVSHSNVMTKSFRGMTSGLYCQSKAHWDSIIMNAPQSDGATEVPFVRFVATMKYEHFLLRNTVFEVFVYHDRQCELDGVASGIVEWTT